MRPSRLLAATAVAGAALTVPLVTPLAAHAASADTAKVSVLHGVPGLTVDVYANGDPILEDFAPGTLAGPLDLPAGDYDIAIREAGQPESAAPAIEANDVAVPGGANATLVAHLDADGKPTLTPFVNDTGKLAAGKARLTVRHTAAAPAVDVRADGTAAFTGLTNPNEDSADLDAGSISADVVLAGTDQVAIGPADVNLAEGTSTIVYAWGSAADNNLKLAVQTIDGLHSAPGGVPSGTGGLLGDSLPLPLIALVAAGLVAAAGGTRRLVLARQH